MRLLIILFLLFSPITMKSQIIRGQVVELKKTKYHVGIPNFIDGYIWLETEINKIEHKEGIASIPLTIEIDKDGRFDIDMTLVNGDLITLYLQSHSHTYLILRDVPRSELSNVITLLPVLRNVYESTCGFDCFTINSKKTYRAKALEIETSNGTIKYLKKDTWRTRKDSFDKSIFFIRTDYYYELKYGK